MQQKIDSLEVNITEVIRESLTEAVENAEAIKIQKWIVDTGGPPLPEEIKKLTPQQRFEAFRDNKLSPESRLWMETMRKAKMNFWEMRARILFAGEQKSLTLPQPSLTEGDYIDPGSIHRRDH